MGAAELRFTSGNGCGQFFSLRGPGMIISRRDAKALGLKKAWASFVSVQSNGARAIPPAVGTDWA